MGTDTIDAAEAPTIIYLGNRAAIEIVDDPDSGAKVRRPIGIPKSATKIVLAPGTTILAAAQDITHPTSGVWQAHSDADAPAWVAATDPSLAQLLASHWGCELREPDHDAWAAGPTYPDAAADHGTDAGEEG